MAIGFGVFVHGGWKMFGDELKAIKSLKMIKDEKITAYSVETAGTFDLESELDLYYSGVGRVRFEFKGSSDILEIGRIIAKYALR